MSKGGARPSSLLAGVGRGAVTGFLEPSCSLIVGWLMYGALVFVLSSLQGISHFKPCMI